MTAHDDAANRLATAGFDPILVRPQGCPRKRRPHSCANCAVGVVWVGKGRPS